MEYKDIRENGNQGIRGSLENEISQEKETDEKESEWCRRYGC